MFSELAKGPRFPCCGSDAPGGEAPLVSVFRHTGIPRTAMGLNLAVVGLVFYGSVSIQKAGLSGSYRFAADSPVEGAGFEPSVPRQRTLFETAPFELAFPMGRERDRGFESLFLHRRVWLREF